ncbi:adrenodoxin-like protein 2, mitochondrial isoform X2 [Bemisia tabaci]|uniref:adrenodoxin-like protein 2, mitochondrial isoform X2 n=1 Tax=Bemisia tabaci TaxID=7038 RepID=UPI003B280644
MIQHHRLPTSFLNFQRLPFHGSPPSNSMALRILFQNRRIRPSAILPSTPRRSFLVPKVNCHGRSPSIAKRNLSVSCSLFQKEPSIGVTFIRHNGERIAVQGKEGDSLLDVIVNNNLDFDAFGACEGTLTCSTCHVILRKEDYDRLPEKPTDEELDMLDLAHGLCDTIKRRKMENDHC